jgi:formate dehydrogenase major subunit
MSAAPTTKVTVDGVEVEFAPGATILDAAKAAERWVPTICFDERQAPFGACRVCLVGVAGSPKPLPACTTLCRDGMELPEAPAPRTELAQVAERLEVGGPRWGGATHSVDEDLRHPYLALRHEFCISCGRCVRACDEVQGAFALTATGRGFGANITAGLDAGFEDSTCVACGACADTCPTDAIIEISLVRQSERERS